MVEFVRDNFISLLATSIAYLKAIILMPLIIKLVGPTVYGGYVLLISFLSITWGISSFGVGTKAKRFLPSCKTKHERQKLFYRQFYFCFAAVISLAVLLYAFEPLIRLSLLNNSVEYARWVPSIYLVSFFLFAQACDYYRFTSRVARTSFFSVLYPYLHISLVMVIFYYGDIVNLDVLILAEVASAFCLSLILFVGILKEVSLTFVLYTAKELWEEIRLGVPIAVNVVIDFVLAASDKFIIAALLSVTAVGFYQPAYLLGSVLMLVPKGVGMVLPQLLAKAVDSGDEELAQKMMDSAILLFLVAAVPFVFGSFVLSYDLLVILADTEIANSVWYVTPVVALGMIFYGLTYLLSCILLVLLKTTLIFWINLSAAVFNFVLNVALIYLFKDVMVAAVTTLMSYLATFLYLNYRIATVWKVRYNLQPIAISFVVSAFLAICADTLVLDHFERGSMLLTSIVLISFILFYLALMMAFPVNRRMLLDLGKA